MRISFSGAFGERRVSPRNLTAALLSKLINLEGIVTKASLVRPKVVKSVHYSEETKQFTSREYRCKSWGSTARSLTPCPCSECKGR